MPNMQHNIDADTASALSRMSAIARVRESHGRTATQGFEDAIKLAQCLTFIRRAKPEANDSDVLNEAIVALRVTPEEGQAIAAAGLPSDTPGEVVLTPQLEAIIARCCREMQISPDRIAGLLWAIRSEVVAANAAPPPPSSTSEEVGIVLQRLSARMATALRDVGALEAALRRAVELAPQRPLEQNQHFQAAAAQTCNMVAISADEISFWLGRLTQAAESFIKAENYPA